MSEAAVHVASGKVREIFELDDERLLLVASDRISIFDVVLPTEIPDKGRVLTGLSAFWFARTRDICPEPPARAAAGRPLDRVPAAEDAPDRVRRARLPRRLRLEGLPARPARRRGHRCPRACASPTGCPSRSSRRRRRRRTGHDENIDARRRPSSSARTPRGGRARSSIALYRFGAEHAAARGIILADTKFEFGSDEDGPPRPRRRGAHARLLPLLARRRVRARPRAALVRQAVRARLLRGARLGQEPPRPRAPRRGRRGHPRALRRGVRAHHRHLVRRVPRRPGGRAAMKATVLVRPEAGHPRPAGRGGRGSSRPPRVRGERGASRHG